MSDESWTRVVELASSGDVRPLSSALESLHPRYVREAFLLSFRVQSEASFALLDWIGDQAPPPEGTERRTHWLYANNNVLHVALRLETLPAHAEAVVTRSLKVAANNPLIYQNAAGVFCRLQMHELALDAVRMAVDADVEGLAGFVDDADLACLHSNEEFKALLAPAVAAASSALATTMAPWRKRFGGVVPDEWESFIRHRMLGRELPADVQAIIESPSPADELLGLEVIWVCRGKRGLLQGDWRAGYAPSLGVSALVFVEENGASWAASSLWMGLQVLAEAARQPTRARESLLTDASNYQRTLHTLSEAKADVLEASAALASQLQPRAQHDAQPRAQHVAQHDAEADRMTELRGLAEAAGPASSEVFILKPTVRPWQTSAARIGGPASVDVWPRGERGAPLMHLLTLDLNELPALRIFHSSLTEARRLSVFVGPDRGFATESACVVSVDAAGMAEEAQGPLRPRQALRFEKLGVPATLVGGAKASWTLAETRLADALHRRSRLQHGQDGPELVFCPEDVGLAPSSNSARQRVHRLTMDGLEVADDKRPCEELLALCGARLAPESDVWADFCRGPSSMLEQLLVRMCALASASFNLGFALYGESIEWTLCGTTHTATLDSATTRSALESLFETLGVIFAEENVGFRFVWTGKRVLLVSPGWAAYLAPHLASTSLRNDTSFGDGDSFDDAPLPTNPSLEDLIPPAQVCSRDTSYASLLAWHAEEMAKQFGLDGFSTSSRVRADESGRMRLSAGFANSRWTSVLPGASVTNFTPFVRDMNRSAFSEDAASRIYEFRLGMFASGTLFATPGEAESLRAAGWLVEHWRLGWARRTLGEQGIEVSGYARASDLILLGRQMAALMAKKASLRVFAEGDDFSVSAYGKRGALALDPRQTLTTPRLATLARGVNAVLARAAHAKRWVVFQGEFDRRLLLVSKAWAKTLADISASVAQSLEEGFECDARSLLPVSYPRVLPDLVTPSVPAVESIIPPARVMSSDFKCSARTTDYPELLLGLAELAKLDLIVEPFARETREPWSYFVQATFEGAHTELEVGSGKYADVTPMLDYLNELLEAAGSKRRLCFYSQAQDDGVVFVDEEEAQVLAGFELAQWPEG